MKTLFLNLLIVSFVLGFAHISGAIDDDSLILFYSFTGGSGDKVKDLSGNGNDGTLVGGKWTSGKYGRGVHLGVKDEYIEFSNILEPKGTIGFWFKPDWDGSDKEDYRIFDASLGGIYFFISKGADHADINPEDFGFYFEDAADADWQDIEFDPAGVISKGEWVHVAATWEFDGGSAFVYIDGKEAATSPNKLGGFPALHSNPRFGMEVIKYVASKNGAKGVIDEITIYNRALTEKEIEKDLTFSAPVESSEKLATTWSGIKATE
jgi:arabinan endo-1,5-alpha-L-arabinosidase